MGRFGIEEVAGPKYQYPCQIRRGALSDLHEWDEDGIDRGEEDIRAPLDVGDHDGRDHDDQEIDAPVDNIRRRRTLGTSPEGIDFRSVEPRHGEVRGAEESNVQEETESGTIGRSRGSRDETSECDDHGDHLTGAADEEEFAATERLDRPERHEGEDGVDYHVDASE